MKEKEQRTEENGGEKTCCAIGTAPSMPERGNVQAITGSTYFF
jgi:hypothetical protein